MPSGTDVVNSLHEKIEALAERALAEDLPPHQSQALCGAAKELAEAAAWLKKPDAPH